jgi:hypothetical protein
MGTLDDLADELFGAMKAHAAGAGAPKRDTSPAPSALDAHLASIVARPVRAPAVREPVEIRTELGKEIVERGRREGWLPKPAPATPATPSPDAELRQLAREAGDGARGAARADRTNVAGRVDTLRRSGARRGPDRE